MENQPLVSIIVITYNSSEYVKETLDSTLAQTYPNIEVIISDDCSTDNTVEICRNWIETNKKSGRIFKLIEANKNTGVAGNCNRGLQVAQGEWIKCIAGDDMLASTAIEDYVTYVSEHPNVKHLIAKSVHFSGYLEKSDLEKPDKISPYLYRTEVTAMFQYNVIKKSFFGSGPTYFIQSEALRAVGGFDERFQMQEDYPLFIKMIGKGYKMEYLDKITVYKRVVKSSLQYDIEKNAIFPKNMVRMIVDYKYQYRKEVMGPLWRMLHTYSLWLQKKIVFYGNSKKSIKCRMLRLLHTTTDPFVWYTRYINFQNWRFSK